MIEFTTAQIDRVERLLSGIPGAIPKAQASAINRALTTARAEIVRTVRKEYIIKAGAVRDAIKITKATSQTPIGRIISVGGAIPLVKFDVNKKNPVIVRVKRTGSKKQIKHAFLQKMHNGHQGIFVRAGKSRYPINQLYGPSIPQMIGNENIIKNAEEKIAETFDKRIEHEINRALEG